MTKKNLNTAEVLNIFWLAPPMSLFDQNVLSIVLQRSTASLERDRYIGTGIPFKRVGRQIRYVKQDVLDWLQNTAPTVFSTSENSVGGENG
jgi:hypothetical protein